MDWELCGIFSVGDHLRRRALVAAVLLYDRLVIPTPPDLDHDEEIRWQHMGWNPRPQRRLLNLIGRDRVITVPWTQVHRRNWEQRYRNALGEQRSGIERAATCGLYFSFTSSLHSLIAAPRCSRFSSLTSASSAKPATTASVLWALAAWK
jgi:hypothetical protein